MANANQTKTNATPGFAIKIENDTELCDATLIAEDENGYYEPVGSVKNINEARVIATSNLRYRTYELEHDGDPGLCPYVYKVWARGLLGCYHVAATIDAAEL